MSAKGSSVVSKLSRAQRSLKAEIRDYEDKRKAYREIEMEASDDDKRGWILQKSHHAAKCASIIYALESQLKAARLRMEALERSYTDVINVESDSD